MRRSGLLLLAAAAVPMAGACVPPRARPAARPPAAQQQAAPAPARKEAPLTAEQKKKIEQLYYRAVGAYGNNDLAAASAYVREILSLSPSHAEALELREKIRLAAGGK